MCPVRVWEASSRTTQLQSQKGKDDTTVPPPPRCGMQMLNADPYHTGTLPQSNRSQTTKLSSDTAIGAFRCDR